MRWRDPDKTGGASAGQGMMGGFVWRISFLLPSLRVWLAVRYSIYTERENAGKTALAAPMRNSAKGIPGRRIESRGQKRRFLSPDANNLIGISVELYTVSGYVFPVGGETHHGKKRIFADLAATFHVFTQDVDHLTFEFQEILSR